MRMAVYKKSFSSISQFFHIIKRRGVLGKVKWIAMVNMLPISNEKKKSIGQRWHEEDWNNSRTSDSVLFSCMHITMLMKKKV